MGHTEHTDFEASFTPREIVSELDRFIVGQRDAKRAVAVALRNRWRRRRVPEALRDEITPKNIILIGSTGVGKTEIARRLAKLAQAPFIKVEASKFTEVGYVGRDVDAMIRDLVEVSVKMVQQEEKERVMVRARDLAEARVLEVLLPNPGYEQGDEGDDQRATRERLRTMLRQGKFDDREIEVEALDRALPTMQIFSNSGIEEMGLNLQDMMGQFMGRAKTKKRRVKVPEALELFSGEEAHKLVDQEWVAKEGLQRASDHGIIFLDEIDKIARRDTVGGPDVSREGVQRDILPVVEGSTVTTKYGVVDTKHILFIAAGAFHVSKVSDLIPELQGRFPIRVELKTLEQEDLLRILKEPQNSLPIQYAALMATENITLEFAEDGLEELARIAHAANASAENIGARRLHTVFERLLEDLSYGATEMGGEKIMVDRAYVTAKVRDLAGQDDLSRYIL